jgi:hypothetical protein
MKRAVDGTLHQIVVWMTDLDHGSGWMRLFPLSYACLILATGRHPLLALVTFCLCSALHN